MGGFYEALSTLLAEFFIGWYGKQRTYPNRYRRRKGRYYRCYSTPQQSPIILLVKKEINCARRVRIGGGIWCHYIGRTSFAKRVTMKLIAENYLLYKQSDDKCHFCYLPIDYICINTESVMLVCDDHSNHISGFNKMKAVPITK